MDLCANFNWGCYNRNCFDKRHWNFSKDTTCTGCGDALKSDAYIRLVNEWTYFAGENDPSKDIFHAGTALEIDDIVEEVLSPHQRPLAGLLYEGWFTNEESPITEDEKHQRPPASVLMIPCGGPHMTHLRCPASRELQRHT